MFKDKNQQSNINVKGLKIDELGVEFIAKVKKGGNTSSIEKDLTQIEIADLEKASDNLKLSFWINIYNAWFLTLRKREGLAKPEIYTKKTLAVSSLFLSLDDIEHGILRKHKFKYALGFITNPLASLNIKRLAVKKLNCLIHFALNCGAKSCPPITVYHSKTINKQLESSTLNFLELETTIDKSNKRVFVSTLFKWYLADFGSYKGIRSLLSRFLKQDLKEYKLVFTAYDWTEKLDNFR